MLLEFGACYHRYTSPIIRNAVIGRPTDAMLRLDAAIRDCVEAVIQAARPGRTGHEVAVEAGKAVEAIQGELYHYGTYAYAVGYSCSAPKRSVYIAEGEDTILENGMVFHLPIAFRKPHEFGIARSETILIRQDGCEVLTSVPRQLHVVGG